MAVANKLFTTAYTKEINEEERSIIAWGSKAIVDRDKEIIKGDAWDLKAYRKHPIIILSHNYKELWVGKSLWLKPSEKGLLFKAQFATTEAAKEAFQLVKDTGIAAFSVGFIPKKWEDKIVGEMTDEEKEMVKGSGLNDKDKVKIYTKCELLEISLVSVPACPTAVLAAYNEGKIKTKELQDKIKETIEIIDEEEESSDDLSGINKEIDEEKKENITEKEVIEIFSGLKDEEEKEVVLKPEETDDYIRIPVRDCKVTATITISANEGIKALYCGKIKKIRTYLFAKAKGWTMAKAKKWVADHGKEYDDIDIKDFEVEEDVETHKPEEKEEPNKSFSLNEIYEIVKENKELITALEEVTAELKAGAVLNKKNKSDLKEAQAKIQNVLDSAETAEPAEEGKQPFNCECIKCGYKMTSDKHCDTLKCPKCGGEMRRAERPGPGKETDDLEIEEPAELEIDEKEGQEQKDDAEEKEETFDINADEIKGIVKEALNEQTDKITENLKQDINDNFKRLTGKVM